MKTRLFMAVLAGATLAVVGVSAATEQVVGPRADEFRDGPFFVSWRYAMQGGGLVAPTRKVSSKTPPTFRAGEGFEFNITLRVPPGQKNPCRNGGCEMEATITVVGDDGLKGTIGEWQDTGVLRTGLQTFSFAREIPYLNAGYKYYLDYQVRKGGKSLVTANHFPFRIRQ